MPLLALQLFLTRIRQGWALLSNDLFWSVKAKAKCVAWMVMLIGVVDAIITTKTAWYLYFPNACFIGVSLAYCLKQWWFSRRLHAWADDFYRAQMELTVSKVMNRAKADLAAYTEKWDGSHFHRR